MNFLEFIEAIAKIAERISAIPLYNYNKELDSEERKIQPLHNKIEGFVSILFIRLKQTIYSTFAA